MDSALLYSKVNSLPEQLQREVLDFIDFLLSKKKHEKSQNFQIKKKSPRFGSAKGKYKMSADFDEPLEDFKEYMA